MWKRDITDTHLNTELYTKRERKKQTFNICKQIYTHYIHTDTDLTLKMNIDNAEEL